MMNELSSIDIVCLSAEFENVSLSAMFKFVFPLLILMSGMDLSWTQVKTCFKITPTGF